MCSNDTTAGISTISVAENTTDCDLNEVVAALCNGQDQCTVTIADLDLSSACLVDDVDLDFAALALTGECVDEVDILPILVTLVTAIISFGMGVSVAPEGNNGAPSASIGPLLSVLSSHACHIASG